MALLTSLSGFWTGIDGFAIGSDFRFWSKVSKFAMELLSKQHFVPGIVASENNGQKFARWQYVLNDQDDLTRMSMLAGGMPPICRSLVQNKLSHPESYLSDFLNTAVDGSIRRWMPLSELSSKTTGLSSAWLESLATGAPIKIHANGLKSLSEGIKTWSEPIHEIHTSGFRTCFRLEAPLPEADDNWSLRYFLQAADDPSLLVPAGDVWKESGDSLQFLKRKFDHPQEKMLADLGKASKLFSPIEDSLNTATPVGAKFDTKQAYAFLKEAAPLLSESGFGVLIPPWWNKGAAKLGIKLNVKPKPEPKTGRGIFTFDSIVNYNWQLALGGEPMSEEEFRHLSSLKEPLVRIRGQWVELNKDEIDTAIKLTFQRNVNFT